MKRKQIDNFYLVIGDIALNKTKRKGRTYIEVAMTEDDRRALFNYPSLDLFCGNLTPKEVDYAKGEIKRNLNLLKEQKLNG